MPNSNRDKPISVLYHALRARRRRLAIQILAEADDTTVSTRELARDITSRECGIPSERATGEPYRNVYNALSQTHLPTLADASIVIYDSKRQTVSRGTNFCLVLLLLSIDSAAIDTIQNKI
ncbi:DUF7344 domain-containing protein [Haloarcula amylolytica]